ncbi:MAG TPA: MFS transporter [Streptosporangiaceae bacterium]|jgi:EmrB/QacA subfamily drug resistance transporter
MTATVEQTPRGDSFGSLNETVQHRKLAVQPLRSLRERQIALLVLCAGTLMIVVDTSVVNVALPSIQRSLGFSQANLAWMVNAYLIPFGGLLLFAGRLGDLIGPKRLFAGGFALFTVSSMVAGLAQDQWMLIGARFGQGVGGALATAVALGMIATMFPKPQEQVKAIGFYAFVAATGAGLGLLLGGVLTQSLNWHWIFFVNVPIGILTVTFGLRLLDDLREIGKEKGADVLGALLITSSLMLLVYTIVQTSQHSWGSARTLLLGGGALLLLAGFVVREATARNPLVPLGIFRARNVAWSNIVQSLMVAGLGGLFFLGALYMQQVLHYGVIEVGLAFLPATAIIGVLSLKATPKLINNVEAKAVLLGGLVLIAAGLLLFARVPVHGRYLTDVLPSMVLLGVGSGLSFPAVLTIAVADATTSDSGLRSGLINTTQQVGPAIGLAVMATVSASHTVHALAAGTAVAPALTSGYRLAFFIGAGLAAAGFVLCLFFLQPAVPKTAPKLLDHGGGVSGDMLHRDLTGAVDADFMAIGMGGAGMMAMLWSIAMGKRTVGVELRGDPYVSVMHWSIREDYYHHLALIDHLMLERYGADRLPKRGDGRLLKLSDCLYSPDSVAGDARADEVIYGFDVDAHIGGGIRHSELIDDRWRDGQPVRSLTRGGAIEPPTQPNLDRVGVPMKEVLESPAMFQAGAEELLILMRRYLEGLEAMDLERGDEPRIRMFTYHRVVTGHARRPGWRGRLPFGWNMTAQEGFVTEPDGRKRILIEAVREYDEKNKFRRERIPGTEVLDLGVPELFMLAEGADSPDAARLGLKLEQVRVDRQDGRGPVPAEADYLAGNIELYFDSRIRRRIASEFDKEGNEYWVRQISLGHEDDSEVGWTLIEIPEFKSFDPVVAGLVPPGTEKKSAQYYAGYQFLIREYFLDQMSFITELPKKEILKIQLAYGPKMFSVVERIGDDALVAPNGVVAGDSFGTGHVLTSGGTMTGMVGHASRVLRYWQAREAGVSTGQAARALADGIKEDTSAWIEHSAPEFQQAPPFKRAEGAGPSPRTDLAVHGQMMDDIRMLRRSIVPLDQRDEWSRFVLHTGHLWAYNLPELLDTHPAARDEIEVVVPLTVAEIELAARKDRISATTQGRRTARRMDHPLENHQHEMEHVNG